MFVDKKSSILHSVPMQPGINLLPAENFFMGVDWIWNDNHSLEFQILEDGFPKIPFYKIIKMEADKHLQPRKT